MRLSAALLALMLTACQSAGGGGIQKEERQERLQRAEALFRERCKTSGEFIKRTVDKVEGIYLLKLRPKRINYGDQFVLDDPYGHDSGGDQYIKSFLHGYHKPSPNRVEGDPLRHGYRYIEAIDPADGKRYRYTGEVKMVTRTTSILMGGDGKTTFSAKEFVLDKTPASGEPPRYAVTYDDISTREERELWIAGSSLKVIDLKSNEVIAERIGYMLDRGQGNTSGGRSPWLWAASNACPDFQRYVNSIVSSPGFSKQANQTDDFTEKVLRPVMEK